MKDAFSRIYQNRLWNGRVSASGPGSDLEETAAIRAELPKIVEVFGVTSILDAPCGDFNWMKELTLPEYIGIDIVPEIITENIRKYGPRFLMGDLRVAPLPKVDLILCRDCLAHLTLEDGQKIIENFRKSGSKFLLATTYPRTWPNHNTPFWTVDGLVHDLTPGDCREVNLEIAPFDLGRAHIRPQENNAGKELGLWKL